MAIKVNGHTVVHDSLKGSFETVNVGSYTTAGLPTDAVEGDVAYNSSEGAIVFWNGTEWKKSQGGALQEVPGDMAPLSSSFTSGSTDIEGPVEVTWTDWATVNLPAGYTYLQTNVYLSNTETFVGSTKYTYVDSGKTSTSIQDFSFNKDDTIYIIVEYLTEEGFNRLADTLEGIQLAEQGTGFSYVEVYDSTAEVDLTSFYYVEDISYMVFPRGNSGQGDAGWGSNDERGRGGNGGNSNVIYHSTFPYNTSPGDGTLGSSITIQAGQRIQPDVIAIGGVGGGGSGSTHNGSPGSDNPNPDPVNLSAYPEFDQAITVQGSTSGAYGGSPGGSGNQSSAHWGGGGGGGGGGVKLTYKAASGLGTAPSNSGGKGTSGQGTGDPGRSPGSPGNPGNGGQGFTAGGGGSGGKARNGHQTNPAGGSGGAGAKPLTLVCIAHKDFLIGTTKVTEARQALTPPLYMYTADNGTKYSAPQTDVPTEDASGESGPSNIDGHYPLYDFASSAAAADDNNEYRAIQIDGNNYFVPVNSSTGVWYHGEYQEPQDVLGYWPVYYQKLDAEKASPTNSVTEYELSGSYYYMPDNVTTSYQGNSPYWQSLNSIP